MNKRPHTKFEKSDLVLLFELASGWYLEDYLWDRSSKGWSWARISDEMNSMIRKLLDPKVAKAKLFNVNSSNLNRWCGMFGIRSIVKPGPKPKKGERDVIKS
ncbi:hypothetical protein KA005_44535 [bacterium]|nr:hypothetical protein [bacterium]